MKYDFAKALFAFGLSWCVGCFAIVIILGIVRMHDLDNIKQLTGHNLASLQTLKANCEKSLPRDKQCQLSVVVSAEEGK